MFGVPSQLLGIDGSQTFANYEMANLAFWTDTIIPLFEWLIDALNRCLCRFMAMTLFSLRRESIDALEPRRKEKFARVQAAEFMTIDEKRRSVGMDEFPHKLGESLLLSGRGVQLGADGSIVALAINTDVDSAADPLTDTYDPTKDPNKVQPAVDPFQNPTQKPTHPSIVNGLKRTATPPNAPNA